jgi:hypothetical protein
MSNKIMLEVILGIALALSLLTPVSSASAESVPSPLHDGPWPIRNGHNYQPTQHELRALHLEDVTPDQARAIDRLYKELLTDSEGTRKQHPASDH